MKLMLKNKSTFFLFFLMLPCDAQLHPHILKVVDERPADGFDPKSYLITSDIEPITKKTFAHLFSTQPPLSVVQACCKTEEGTAIVRYYSQLSFESIFSKPGSLKGIHDSFSYGAKIIDGSLEVTSFANYIENIGIENSSETKQLMRNWYAIYQPKKKNCCTPIKLAATGTTLLGMGVLALIFSNWQTIEKCCPQ
ncbi:hypothetical protein HYX58_05225 [Candidatus Dependentiae bacterium]|nr:hypothetical protein [Candidatus Dependentiae bacterium]